MDKKDKRKNVKIKPEHWRELRQYVADNDLTIQGVVDSLLGKFKECIEEGKYGKKD